MSRDIFQHIFQSLNLESMAFIKEMTTGASNLLFVTTYRRTQFLYRKVNKTFFVANIYGY